MRHGHASVQPNGAQGSPTYTSWRMMVQRCTNSKRKDYENYGGRGISVYFGWLGAGGFDEFLADVGVRPVGTSLDRINPDGHYEPGNVQWSTAAVQNSNKSGYIIEFNGERLTTYEWAERLGLHPGALRKRFSRGWTQERALTATNKRERKCKRKHPKRRPKSV